ncbi:alpha/beta fold hydrolase [Streptomyces griseofuscus]|uniref:alpha/beta fold hydrolase n=1 Tax=Streptomyces griseofuscus TaxID=146922 RepID=UPI0033F52C64
MYPATLTNLGERAHLGGVDTGLGTHITDVVNVILHEDLRDVVLVGHSYAGTVLPGLADRVLATRVYVDSAPTADGESHFGIHPAEAIEGMARARPRARGRLAPARADFAETAAHPGGEGSPGSSAG